MYAFRVGLQRMSDLLLSFPQHKERKSNADDHGNIMMMS
jgi:hypothetical protein